MRMTDDLGNVADNTQSIAENLERIANALEVLASVFIVPALLLNRLNTRLVEAVA